LIEISGGMPVASVWIAVDLENGEVGVGAPACRAFFEVLERKGLVQTAAENRSS